jgi:hypothetical protein
MELAALITWILTALGGAYMLSVWISKGGTAPTAEAASRRR